MITFLHSSIFSWVRIKVTVLNVAVVFSVIHLNTAVTVHMHYAIRILNVNSSWHEDRLRGTFECITLVGVPYFCAGVYSGHM